MTGYISHWNLNRRAIPNQIGTNFFQYKLSSFTANLLSVSCANLTDGSQHFYSRPSTQQIKSFYNSYVFFSPHFSWWPIRWNVNFFPFILTLLHLQENYYFFIIFLIEMNLGKIWKLKITYCKYSNDIKKYVWLLYWVLIILSNLKIYVQEDVCVYVYISQTADSYVPNCYATLNKLYRLPGVIIIFIYSSLIPHHLHCYSLLHHLFKIYIFVGL